MAADVVEWHKYSGGALEPDTAVWAELPLPWDVLSGKTECTRHTIAEICRKHGVDPIKKQWIAPPSGEQPVAVFKPTPELVHGVTVSNPHLAKILKQAGWFSGKKVRPITELIPPIEVHKDKHSFVTGVKTDSFKSPIKTKPGKWINAIKRWLFS